MSRVVQQARSLRKRATDAEKLLWRRMRNRQLAGLKFRRQEPIGDRIADFYCAEARLVVEMDGSGRAYDTKRAADLARELELHEKRIRVPRFWNTDVFDNLDGILNAIIYAADPERSLWAGDVRCADPHLSPLPRGEEGGGARHEITLETAPNE